MDNCVLRVEPHDRAREEHEEEGAAGTICDEPTTTPIHHSPALTCREFGSKAGLGRKE